MDPPKKERCTYQWGKPYEYKSAKHVNSGSICSDDACALQLNWERRAMEFKSQEKDALASDSYSTVNKRKTTHVSTDRKGKKRKANDYPQWGFQDAKVNLKYFYFSFTTNFATCNIDFYCVTSCVTKYLGGNNTVNIALQFATPQQCSP